jgi:Periplasmic binding protein-like domain
MSTTSEAIAATVTDARHHVVWADQSMDGGADGVRRRVERFPDLDGVPAYNDIMAIGAIRALEDLGRRVPEDVAVIGVDDIALSALVRPSLTSVRRCAATLTVHPDVRRLMCHSCVATLPDDRRDQCRRTILPSCSPASMRDSAAGYSARSRTSSTCTASPPPINVVTSANS